MKKSSVWSFFVSIILITAGVGIAQETDHYFLSKTRGRFWSYKGTTEDPLRIRFELESVNHSDDTGKLYEISLSSNDEVVNFIAQIMGLAAPASGDIFLEHEGSSQQEITSLSKVTFRTYRPAKVPQVRNIVFENSKGLSELGMLPTYRCEAWWYGQIGKNDRSCVPPR